MTSEAQKRATARYDAINVLRVTTKFNRRTEPDLVAFIETFESKQGLIKKAVREYMENHPKD